ncbi:winged helix-turn-helix domain-containing protein [Streptomyces yaizuensis]|uniref:Winged helix-turn-helix domain-containing protein n=1 Tax=Streptomyces yaizuensis TaxID=2989713 RepID=A0ABQ5NUI1_9ACTN|nr:winged helix-turn-helix domain-containing protein [Streptomyces sp. YSPA8]GLF94031.1 winged helix-turn-helix domain-containing protein [Streptomyces sp. YSPA8]
MANSRPFHAVPAQATHAAHATATAAGGTAAPNRGRHRLRAIDRDEVVPPGGLADVVELLPPGATWVPAPQHNLPSLPGRPPMLGYLLLVPAVRPATAATAVVERPSMEAAEAAEATDPGPVRIDAAERVAHVDGRALDLTYLEFELLSHLVAHPHRVHTRDQLVTTVWGYGHVGDGRTVDVHVARLRRKLGERYRHTIQTVRRVGYKYTP